MIERVDLGFYDIDEMTDTMKFLDGKAEILDYGVFQATLQSIHLKNMQLAYDEKSLGYKIQGSIKKGYISFIIFSSDAPVVNNGIQFHSSSMLIVEDIDDIDAVMPTACKVFALKVKKELFHKVYHEYFGHEYQYLPKKRINLQTDASAFKFKIQSLINFFLTNVELTLNSPEIQEIESELLREVLFLFEGSTIDIPHINAHQLAKDLYAMIINNIQSDISIAKICNELQCSERTAYKAFKSLYGITPNQMLIHLRLSHIHRNLKASSPQDNSVKNIAHQYAFYHMGYLSQIYKKKYSTSPSTTLNYVKPFLANPA